MQLNKPTSYSKLLRYKLTEVPTQIEKLTGVRVSRASIERWHRAGIRGQRLGVIKIGGRNYVDASELQRFLKAVNGEPE